MKFISDFLHKNFYPGVLLFVTLVIVPMGPSPRAAKMTVVAISGSCKIVQIADESESCTQPAALIYSALPNGRVLFQVTLSDDRVLAFVGGKDSQPQPEKYILYLDRIRYNNVATSVTGTCAQNISTDGEFVSRVLCNATGIDGKRWLLDFRGDGKPVNIDHLPWNDDAN